MAKGPIRVKVNGSGSAVPAAPAMELWQGGFVDGLLLRAASDPITAAKAGLAVFRVHNPPSADVRVIPAGSSSTTDELPLDVYCEREGIGEAGKQEILNGVLGVSPSVLEWVACIPAIAERVVLHRRGAPFALRLVGGSPVHHVFKHWLKFRYGSSPIVHARMAFGAGAVRSTNRAERWLTRIGTDGAGPNDAYIAAGVPRDPNAFATPWPASSRGLKTVEAVYDNGRRENVYGALVHAYDQEGKTFKVYGDSYLTRERNGLAYQAGAESNGLDLLQTDVPPTNPAQWYGDWLYFVSLLLPEPTNATGAYRPGVYKRGGEVVEVNLGHTNGLNTNASENGKPVLVSDYPVPPQRPNGVGSAFFLRFETVDENGQTVVGVWDDTQTLYRHAFWEERAVFNEPAGFLRLEISVATGGPNACPKNALVAGATVYTGGAYFEVVPEGGAPAPEVSREGGWLKVAVPLEGQLKEAGGDAWAPFQEKTFGYKMSFYSSPTFRIYPKAVFAWGEEPKVPDGAFDAFEPFPLAGGGK